MLGWEFPPHISGGLGTACYGMTRGLDQIGVNVCFVLPTAVPVSAASHVTLRSPTDLRQPCPGKPNRRSTVGMVEQVDHVFEHVELHKVDAVLQPYAQPAQFEQAVRRMVSQQRRLAEAAGAEVTETPGGEPEPEVSLPPSAQQQQPMPSGSFVRGGGAHYGENLFSQVQRYARLAVELSQGETFDIVHAHDWMTYPAAVAVKAASNRPLVVHVHSTEFDRSGDNVNQGIYDIERMGMHAADRVVCVSFLTRNIVTRRYGVPASKVDVVHNAVDLPDAGDLGMKPIRGDERLVLFLGRVTMQKGPEYFLQAAKKVVERFQKVRFVMAGSGDMIARCIEEAATLGIGRYVTFTGFLRGSDVARVFQMADLYVMPSVSEPFGISPLEALSHNVPVIISKQSGVSEVLTHALKVDFWDTDEMANKILAVLRHPPLQRTLRQHGQIELRKLSWNDSARKIREVYENVLGASPAG
jgi:glycosyltransferase involved in cell wall biosynthesis